jgi:D-serine deaminase-like pyridoxal phosphate-dependent protein
MASFFAGRQATLRPHIKTHKCPILAHKQVAAGAVGVTCAKLSEAEVLVQAGLKDILIANQVVAGTKVERLAQLGRHARLAVAVDDPENVHELDRAAQRVGANLRVLVEVDVGMQRCGVPPGPPALKLARKVASASRLRFDGLMGYEGHAVFVGDRDLRLEAVKQAMTQLTDTAAIIRAEGLEVTTVSAGGTGTYDLTGSIPGVTEVQAGSYLLMDARYAKMRLGFRTAITCLATVISTPAQGRAILDVGCKSLTYEFGLPEVLSPPGARLTGLNEEHGYLEYAAHTGPLSIGQRVELIPSHVCTTVNLHDTFCALRGEAVEAIWPIAARGMAC